VFNTNKLRVKGSVFFSIVRGTFYSLEKKGGVCRCKVKVEWISLVTAPLIKCIRWCGGFAMLRCGVATRTRAVAMESFRAY
jgi:hypothetical protein